MELRPFHLTLSLAAVHGNCEQPASYTAWLVVCDHTLPAKGVLYRLPRTGNRDQESPSKVAKEDTNVWLASNLLSRWFSCELKITHNRSKSLRIIQHHSLPFKKIQKLHKRFQHFVNLNDRGLWLRLLGRFRAFMATYQLPFLKLSISLPLPAGSRTIKGETTQTCKRLHNG